MMRFLLAAIVLCLATFNSQASANECKKIIASAHPNYPPYHWREGNEIVGASVDLNRLVFQEIGVEFAAVYSGPWKRVLATAESNMIDFVMSLKRTSEREAFLRFTDYPAFPNPFTAFTLVENSFDLERWSDLKALKGSKNAGDRYGQPLDSYVLEILKLPDNDSLEDNVNRLMLDRLDYIIHGRYVGQAHFGIIEGGEKIVPLEKDIIGGFIHSGFSLGSSCAVHLEYLNRRYLELFGDGTAERLLEVNIERWVAFNHRQKAGEENTRRQN
ncbi:substrate-binding periplasmic protein [Roseibium sp.]|uniref:substrate-binding periplasmic protein n=1 Tax=Roseibium sp. TaxID=1936156 RepID=UPI003BB0979B